MNMSTRYILVIATAGLLIAASETKRGDVTEARVIAEASTGSDWLVGGRSFDEQHFSPLKQITDQNISTLGLAWAADIPSAMGLATNPSSSTASYTSALHNLACTPSMRSPEKCCGNSIPRSASIGCEIRGR